MRHYASHGVPELSVARERLSIEIFLIELSIVSLSDESMRLVTSPPPRIV